VCIVAAVIFYSIDRKIFHYLKKEEYKRKKLQAILWMGHALSVWTISTLILIILKVSYPQTLETTYKLDEKSLENLKSEIPDSILIKLKALKDEGIRGKKEFLESLISTIGEEQTKEYELVIREKASIVQNLFILISRNVLSTLNTICFLFVVARLDYNFKFLKRFFVKYENSLFKIGGIIFLLVVATSIISIKTSTKVTTYFDLLVGFLILLCLLAGLLYSFHRRKYKWPLKSLTVFILLIVLISQFLEISKFREVLYETLNCSIKSTHLIAKNNPHYNPVEPIHYYKENNPDDDFRWSMLLIYKIFLIFLFAVLVVSWSFENLKRLPILKISGRDPHNKSAWVKPIIPEKNYSEARISERSLKALDFFIECRRKKEWVSVSFDSEITYDDISLLIQELKDKANVDEEDIFLNKDQNKYMLNFLPENIFEEGIKNDLK